MKFHPLLLVGLSLGMCANGMAVTTTQAAADSDHKPWTLESTLLFLKASDNETMNFGYRDQKHEPGYRLMLGYQPTPCSFGYRVTYTNWEGTHLGYTRENGPELDMVDFEMFRSFEAYGCEGSYSLGVRHMHIYETYAFSDVDYAGTGPVLGAQLKRPLIGQLSFYLDAQSTLLIGHDKAREISNRMWTAQLGGGFLYELDLNFTQASLKLGYERQYYHSATYRSADATIDGLVLTAGFAF